MSYARWSGSGAAEALVLGTDNWTPALGGEKVRQNLNAIHARGGSGGWLGGSRSQEVFSATEIAVPEYWDVLLDWRHIGGKTVVARCEVYTENAGTSVTARLKNVTDAVNTDGSAVSTADTWTESVITIPTPGVLAVKRYRLYIVGSNATNGIRGCGCVELYDALY